MITLQMDLPELENELKSIAAAQRTSIELVVMGALAQCFNKPQLLGTLGFQARPMSAVAHCMST